MRITFSGGGLQAVPNPTDFKFKKADRVKIVSKDFFGSGLTQSSPDEYKVTDRRNTLGYNQYRLEGMSGWWHEINLVAVQN